MPNWPASLPSSPLVEGFDEMPQDNAARFKPEVGPSKARRRGTGAASDVTMAFIMDGDQWDDLIEFYRDDLGEVLSFTGPATLGFTGTFIFTGPPARRAVTSEDFRVECRFQKLA